MIAAVAVCSIAATTQRHFPASSIEVNDQVRQQQALGQRLFFDKRLSADGTISCASCHQPERAFADGRAVSAGVGARHGARNAPSLLEVGTQRSLFWDGRRAALEDQATVPLFSSLEHGLTDEHALQTLLRADSLYTSQFAAAFGTDPGSPSAQQVASALAAFERTLVDGTSIFDEFLQGRPEALPRPAYRGWLVFSQSAQCIRCHRVEGSHPLFTDHDFHALSVGIPAIERKLPALIRRLVVMRAAGQTADQAILGDADMAALGRFVVTLAPTDIGKFKTPGLRNVALTAPYMHDGSVPNLSEAIDLEVYYRGSAEGRPLILTPSEKEDLLAFLNALTVVSEAPRAPRMPATSSIKLE